MNTIELIEDEERRLLRELINQYTLNDIFEVMAQEAETLANLYLKDKKPRLSSYFNEDVERLISLYQR